MTDTTTLAPSYAEIAMLKTSLLDAEARQPLTDEQIEALPAWSHFVGLWPENRKEIARAIEAAHGIAAKKGDAA